MSLRFGFVQVAGGIIGLLMLCLRSFPQDNKTYAAETESESTFLSTPNLAILPTGQGGNRAWKDAVYNEAVRHYKKGQFSQAVSAYKRACNGFAKACTNLGFMYNQGQGVKMSHSLAAEYYKRGCDEGDPLGCTNLGIMYWKVDLPKDDRHAVELFERGCRNGDSGACRDLGYMYHHGYGLSKDENRAVEQYQLADQLSHVHRIPIHAEDGLILISLNIQEESVVLIIDTGSSRTALVRKYLPQGHGLPPVQRVSTVMGSGQAYAVDVSWKLDGREIQLPALVGDFNFPNGAVGILGADVLGMFNSVRFDYSAMILILED